MNAPFVNIGANPDAVNEARVAILAILENTNSENATKCAALNALTTFSFLLLLLF